MNKIAPTATLTLINVRDVQLEQCLSCVAYLSSSERSRLDGIVREQRKLQFLVGRLLLRSMVSRLMNWPVSAINVIERERQSPRVDLVGSDQQVYFSISHTGDWVACASSADVALGLDIELYNAKRNLFGMARHTFGADELARFQHDPDPVKAFYRLWSIKEARFKLTQQYTVAPIEHSYVLSHPEISMVLMSAEALQDFPKCQSVDFEWLKADLRATSEE